MHEAQGDEKVHPRVLSQRGTRGRPVPTDPGREAEAWLPHGALVPPDSLAHTQYTNGVPDP
jgi:hypothetical protein